MSKYIILIPSTLNELEKVYDDTNILSSLDNYIKEQFIYNKMGLLYRQQDDDIIKVLGKDITLICADAEEVNSLKAISIKETNQFEYLNSIEKNLFIEGKWKFISVREANHLNKKSNYDLKNSMNFIAEDLKRNREKISNRKDILEYEKYEEYWKTLDLAQKYEAENINEKERASIVGYDSINVDLDKNLAIVRIKKTEHNYRKDDRILISNKADWSKDDDIGNENLYNRNSLQLGSVESYDKRKRILKVKSDLKNLKKLMEDGTYKKSGFLWVIDIGSKSKLRREKQALRQLFNEETANKNLKEFIPNINYLDPLLENEVNDCFFSDSYNILEESQVESVRNSLKTNDIYLIQGPPGTGKTTVICEIIQYLVNSDKKVLLSSQTNLAVDNVLQKIGSGKNVRAIRIGREEKFLLDSEKYSLEQRVSNVQRNIIQTIKERRTEYIVLEEQLKYKKSIYDIHENMFYEIDKLASVIKNYRDASYQIENINKKMKDLDLSIEELKKTNIEFETISEDKVSRLNEIGRLQEASKYPVEENIIISDIFKELNLNFKDEIIIKNYISLIESIKNLALKLKEKQENLRKKEIEKTRIIDELTKFNTISASNNEYSGFGVENFFEDNNKFKYKSYKLDFLNIDEVTFDIKRLKREFRDLLIHINTLKEKAIKLKRDIDYIINSNQKIWLRLYSKASIEVGDFLRIYIRIQDFKKEFGENLNLSASDFRNLKNYNEYKKKTEKLKNFLDKKEKYEELISYAEKNKIKYKNKLKEYKKDDLISKYLDRYLITIEELDISREEKRCSEYIRKYKDDIRKLKLYKATRTLQNEWKDKLEFYQEAFEDIYINVSNLICATCLGISSYNNNSFLNTTFDYVIVDEAARSTAMELLIPIIRGKKIILVGDHKQISPQIESNILKRLEEEENVSQLELDTVYNKSLFGIMYELANTKIKTLLNKQFRMHSDISSVVSNLFYESSISDGSNVIYNSHGIEKKLDRSFYWVDTDFTSDSLEVKNENMSFYNIKEIEVVENILSWLDFNLKNRKEVGVISPYMAQTVKLRERIDNEYQKIDVEIDTIDAFQGREKDIIIMSLVRNNYEGRIGFIKADSRINVAISRAKELMFLIGNSSFIRSNKNKTGKIYDILNILDNRNCILKNEFFRLGSDNFGLY